MSRSARSHTTRGRSGSVEASAESGRERHPADFKFNWTPRPERRQGGRMAGEEDGNRRRRGRSAVGGRLQSAVRAGAVEQPQPRWAADERYGRVYEYEVIEAPEVDRRRTRSRRRDRSW
ncbi:hypothetical protein HYQ46_012107 [Verticillium longisporum]|nr:hypothetical protein HYQ46_012107 [Verticillium longisporum]